MRNSCGSRQKGCCRSGSAYRRHAAEEQFLDTIIATGSVQKIIAAVLLAIMVLSSDVVGRLLVKVKDAPASSKEFSWFRFPTLFLWR